MMPQDQAPDEDVDEDALYGGIAIDESDYKPSKEVEKSYWQIFKEQALDAAKQIPKEFAKGFLGAYGNIFDTIGANEQSDMQRENQRGKNYGDHEVLTRMAQPGYKPSIYDIAALESDDIAPSFRLPTSEDVGEGIEALGGPEEAETAAGRYLGRGANIYGGGVAFGQLNPAPSFAAGAAAEGVKDMGGDPLLQAAAEIATLLYGEKKVNALQSSKKLVQQMIDEMRQLGYNDQEITLAINSAKKNSNFSKQATKTSKSEAAFEGAQETSNRLLRDTLIESFPGIEHGLRDMNDKAKAIYRGVMATAEQFPIKDAKTFNKAVNDVVRKMKKSLSPSDEKMDLIRRFEESAEKALQGKTADSYIEFYKEMGQMGDWNKITNKEVYLAQIRQAIKDTFESNGAQGKKLAQEFDAANKGVQKVKQAQEVSQLLGKANTMEGFNFKNLKGIFDDPDSWSLLEKSIGAPQTEKLYQIAKIGADIGDFGQKLGSIPRSGWSTSRTGAALLTGLVTQNPKYISAAVVGLATGAQIPGRIATKMLTDPKYQNLVLRTMNAVQSSSPKTLQRALNGWAEYLKEEGIDVEKLS